MEGNQDPVDPVDEVVTKVEGRMECYRSKTGVEVFEVAGC